MLNLYSTFTRINQVHKYKVTASEINFGDLRDVGNQTKALLLSLWNGESCCASVVLAFMTCVCFVAESLRITTINFIVRVPYMLT